MAKSKWFSEPTTKEDFSKVKYITRTIPEHWQGIALVADYETMTFAEKPFTVWNEVDIPKGGRCKSVEKIPATLYRLPIETFLKYAEKVEG